MAPPASASESHEIRTSDRMKIGTGEFVHAAWRYPRLTSARGRAKSQVGAILTIESRSGPRHSATAKQYCPSSSTVARQSTPGHPAVSSGCAFARNHPPFRRDASRRGMLIRRSCRRISRHRWTRSFPEFMAEVCVSSERARRGNIPPFPRATRNRRGRRSGWHLPSTRCHPESAG